MANEAIGNNSNNIDRLEINVKVSGLSKKSIENVNALATALEKLNAVVANFSGLEKYADSLEKVAGAVKTVNKSSVGKTFSRTKNLPMGETDDKTDGGWFNKVQKRDIKYNLEMQKRGGIYRKTAQSMLIYNREVGKSQKDISDSFRDVDVETKKYNDTLSKNTSRISTASVGWAKFTRSIGRIALYRTIRRAIQIIFNSLGQGLSNLRSVDKELDMSLNKLSQSATSLKNSFASIFSGTIKTIEPFITKLSDSLATIINQIEEAKASLRGDAKYTKILTSNTEEWEKALDKVNGTLLSFDKFESLSEDKYTGVVSADVGMSTGEAKKIVDGLHAVQTAIGAITVSIIALKATQLATWFTKVGLSATGLKIAIMSGAIYAILRAIELFKEGDIWGGVLATTIGVGLVGSFLLLNKTLVTQIFQSLGKAFISLLMNATLATGSLAGGIASLSIGFVGLFAAVVEVIEIFKNWDIMNSWQRVVAILGAITTAVFGLALAFGAFHSAWSLGVAAAAITAGITAVAIAVSSAKKEAVTPYAEGGVFEGSGTLYKQAGEAGAEIVAQGSRGTGVTNVEQFTDAMLNALTIYGVARGSDVQFSGDVVMNATKVGELVTPSVYREGTRVGYFKKA